MVRRRSRALSFRDIDDKAAPSITTSPLVGSSRLPAIVSSVDFPEPDGPITATSEPALDREVDVGERMDFGGAGPVALRDSPQLEIAHRRATSLRRMSGSGLGRGRSRARALQATVGGVEPADDRVEPEELGVDDEGEGEVEVRLVLLEPRPLLHQLDEIAAMDLDHVVDRNARHTEGRQAP